MAYRYTDPDTRTVYRRSGGFGDLQGKTVKFWANEAGTVPIDVGLYSESAPSTPGVSTGANTLTVRADQMWPEMWDRVGTSPYMWIQAGTASAPGDLYKVFSDADQRLTALSADVSTSVQITEPPIDVVRRFGADPSGISDSTAALQAALSAAGSVTSDLAVATAAVRLRPGTYRTSAPLNVYGDGVHFLGDGPQMCKIVNSVSDIFHVQGARQIWEGFTAVSDFGGGGHVFVQVGNFVSSTLRNFYFAVYNDSKSVWTAQAGDYLRNTVEDGTIECLYTATVPTWQHIRNPSGGAGACNINTWRGLWIQRSGNYNFWLEATTNYIYDNRFEDINFEVSVGGGIKLLSATGNEINNCVFYDIAAPPGGGKAKQDLIYIGKSGGNNSQSNRLRGLTRHDGTLDTGVVDIRIPVAQGQGTILEHCGAQSSLPSFTVDIGFAEVLIVGGRFVTYLNDTPHYHLEPLLRGTTTAASSATPTPNIASAKVYALTALATNATFGAPTGTATDGQELVIRIKDNGVSRTLAWNAAYRSVGATLPSTTVAGKTIYVRLMYNSGAASWDALAVAQEA